MENGSLLQTFLRFTWSYFFQFYFIILVNSCSLEYVLLLFPLLLMMLKLLYITYYQLVTFFLRIFFLFCLFKSVDLWKILLFVLMCQFPYSLFLSLETRVLIIHRNIKTQLKILPGCILSFKINKFLSEFDMNVYTFNKKICNWNWPHTVDNLLNSDKNINYGWKYFFIIRISLK